MKLRYRGGSSLLMKVSTAMRRVIPSGLMSTSTPERGSAEENVASSRPRSRRNVMRLGQARLARVNHLERDLRAVVEAERDAAKGQELVALGGIVGLIAAHREVRGEEEVPLAALLLEDREQRILEREPRARHETDRGNVRRQGLDRADPLDQRLENAVVVQIDLFHARDLREAEVGGSRSAAWWVPAPRPCGPCPPAPAEPASGWACGATRRLPGGSGVCPATRPAGRPARWKAQPRRRNGVCAGSTVMS